MSDDVKLTKEELEELERRKREGKPTLDEEIVRRYSRDRLSRISLRGAGGGSAVDHGVRSRMEDRLGVDLSHARVIRGPLAEEITSRHSADAVTIANTGMILVRESPRSAPGTTSFNQLLAHELTHVAQAQKGMQFARQHGGDDGEHEQEARGEEAEEGGSLADEDETAARTADGGAGHQQDPDEMSKIPKAVRQLEARRKLIITRAIELMEDAAYYGRDRRGSGI